MRSSIHHRSIPALVPALILVLAGSVGARPQQQLPSSQFASPYLVNWQVAPVALGLSPHFEIQAEDADGQIVSYRWLITRAVISGGGYADSQIEVLENLDALVVFEDSAWSNWTPWPQDEEVAPIEAPELPPYDEQARRIYYLLAVQVMDDAGAVDITRSYGHNLAHFWVADLDPVLGIFEARFGNVATVGPNGIHEIDVAAGTCEFLFSAWGEEYGGVITGLRWGLDLVDPDDPDDAGWGGPAAPDLWTTGPLTISSGIHTVTIQAEDHAGGLTRFVYLLTVIVPPQPQDQLPLLLVDDVYDRISSSWPSQFGVPLDRDIYRDAFWSSALTEAGGPVGFDPVRDIVDTEADDVAVALRTLCNYRAVIWASRASTQSAISREFRPGPSDESRYNWLADYQRVGGNLLLASSRATDAFHMVETIYALPIVYQSMEGDTFGYLGDPMRRVGFGFFLLPDHLQQMRYELQYGYRDLGLSVIDQMSPNSSYVIYGSDPLISVRNGRKAPCAAMKGLVLDDGFADRHAPAIDAAIPTDATIDWRDLDPAYYDNLQNPYIWGDDEFYENPGDRMTPFTYQGCAEGPDELCVEPMFRSVARFDWIRAQHLAADPNDTWPEGYYSVPMSQLCGQYALENLDTAKTSGQVVGFFSHKTVATKPGGRADVVWGFDPYRFDHAAMTEAIHWVLGEHFGLSMRP
jgi:hypothetical protein